MQSLGAAEADCSNLAKAGISLAQDMEVKLWQRPEVQVGGGVMYEAAKQAPTAGQKSLVL